MTASIEFRNVDIIFGDKTDEALKLAHSGVDRSEILKRTGAVLGATQASLTVNEGEISVLMGLSGSGKSTLLRAVNSLNKVTGGEVLVKDGDRMVDVASCDAATLRHIRQKQVAMVFQQFALLPWRTVRENAGFGLELAGVPEAERNAKVDKQLELVGLKQWANKYVHELSGGMQQRVGLARAFATEAPILLMDEQIKKTILFVSHDLEEALKIGNRITIMEGGRIVQSGTPEDIVLKPANDYVRDFIANVNPLSVLTAWNVMRALPELERGEDGWVWLDKRKTTRFKLGPDGKVLAAERDGHPATWVSCDHVETPVEDGHRPVFWARPGTSLKVVMLAIHNTDVAPVAIFDENDRFLGSISIRHVLQAVLKRQD
jgi:glycine betaine/proline transport system ATP-binding protein